MPFWSLFMSTWLKRVHELPTMLKTLCKMRCVRKLKNQFNWSCAPTWHPVPTPWGKLCGCTQDASTQQLKQVHLHHFKRLQKHPKTEYSTRKAIKCLHKFKSPHEALTTHVWLFVREGDGKGSLPVWLVLPLPYNNGSGLLLTVSTCPRHCHLWHKDRENYGSRFHSHSILYVSFALCTLISTVSDPLC